jgi:hypothetical protein
MEVTATVWALRQQLTGGLTETIVKYAHEGSVLKVEMTILDRQSKGIAIDE